MASDPIVFEEQREVGMNSHYLLGVGRVGDYWAGYAIGGGMIFFLHINTGHQLGLVDQAEAIRRVGAIAQDVAQGYGGIEEWFVPEDLRGDPERYRCRTCGEVCCGDDHISDDWDPEWESPGEPE